MDYKSKILKDAKTGTYQADLADGRALFRIVHETSACPALIYNDPGQCTCKSVQIKQVVRRVEFVTFKIDPSFD